VLAKKLNVVLLFMKFLRYTYSYRHVSTSALKMSDIRSKRFRCFIAMYLKRAERKS
jgi:hypothetical protein